MVKTRGSGNEELALVRVLEALADSEAMAGVDSLDHVDRAMLYFIFRKEGDGKGVKVTDLLAADVFGTMPTVLVHVARLMEQGWVEKSVSRRDGRLRVLSSSPKARRFVKKASKVITNAIGERRDDLQQRSVMEQQIVREAE